MQHGRDRLKQPRRSGVDREAEPHFRSRPVPSRAVPVKRYDGAIVAAIDIGVHVDRVSMDEMTKRFLPRLREPAAQVTQKLV